MPHTSSYNLVKITEQFGITLRSIIKKNCGFSIVKAPLIRKSNIGFIIVMCCPPEADIHVKQKEGHSGYLQTTNHVCQN